MMEVAQLQRAQFDVAFALQQRFGALALLSRDECHRGLAGQADMPGAVVGRQPEGHFRAFRRIAPVPGEHEALLQIHLNAPSNHSRRPFYRASSTAPGGLTPAALFTKLADPRTLQDSWRDCPIPPLAPALALHPPARCGTGRMRWR
ncbi:hypothetical protein D9M68_780580 [compost metagenome]